MARCTHVALGKGVTKELSRISAAMEAMEVWHAEWPTLERLRAARRDVLGDAAVTPVHLHGLREGPWGIPGDGAVMDWFTGRRLVSGERVLVPAQTVELANRAGTFDVPPFFSARTNGLASGNTREEALLHARLELAERDCLADYLERGPRGQVGIESVTDPECRGLIGRYLSQDFEVAVIDVTNDLDIPAFVSFIRGPDNPWIFCGAGSHLNPAVALSRALTEAAQLRLVVVLGLREEVDARFERRKIVDQVPFSSVPLGPPVRFPESAADEDRHLRPDIDAVLGSLLEHRDCDPIVLDLTRKDIGLPVVKVLAQELRYGENFFSPRISLHPGRRGGRP